MLHGKIGPRVPSSLVEFQHNHTRDLPIKGCKGVKRALQCFTLYTCALPDSLQCASFKISKLDYISEVKSDILVLYSVKHALHCDLHFTLVHYKCKAL